MKNNELIQRYLYDVVRRLPENQKKDIEEELFTLIEDMVEERQGNGESPESPESPESNIKAVLEELGEPVKLAAKYRGEESHLIGGDYYFLYCQIVKIVLICVGASMVLSAIVSFFVADLDTMDITIRSMQKGFVNIMQEGIINILMIPMALVQAFGFVTIIFYFLEKNQVKLQVKKGPWMVDKLPPVPYKKAVIKKSDCIVGIVFTVIFAVWFICAPEFIGVFLKNTGGEMVSIPLFNMANWSRILPLLLIAFSLGMIEEFVKLIVGHYNHTVMWVTIVCQVCNIGIAVYLLKGLVFLNPNFITGISVLGNMTNINNYDIIKYWNAETVSLILSNLWLAIIIFASLIEIGQTVYKTMRYGLRGNSK